MLIICNGMKRSGSTLQYNYACDIAKLKYNTKEEGYLIKEDFEKNLIKINELINDDKTHVFKTHQCLPFEKLTNANDIKYIYIYRDIRDVALSLINKSQSDIDVIPIIDDQIKVFKEIKKETALLSQKYEFFMSHQKESIIDIANFLNVELTNQEVQDLLLKNSIVSNQKKLRQEKKKLYSKIISSINFISKITPSFIKKYLYVIGVINKLRYYFPSVYITKNQFHINHISVNKGKAGVWKEKLDPLIAENINNTFKIWLIENEYNL